jgi:L-2-hydroxyglutarate oxidase LhgO
MQTNLVPMTQGKEFNVVNEGEPDDQSLRTPVAETPGEEFPGIHIIDDDDMAKHFGPSKENESDEDPENRRRRVNSNGT